MSELKATPGPWECHESAFMADGSDKRAYFIVEADGMRGKSKYNAHLIAAAPELLEALQAMIDYAGQPISHPAAQLARAALAKARGEQP